MAYGDLGVPGVVGPKVGFGRVVVSANNEKFAGLAQNSHAGPSV